MDVAKETTLDTLTIDQVLARIRIDPETGKGSVIDVISVVTGKDNNHAAETLRRLSVEFSDVNARCVNFQFPGRGQRLTPVADTPTLVEIAWLCPGKAAKEFRRKGAVTLCRALGGDLSLVDEIEARHRAIAGTGEQKTILNGTGVSQSVANGTALVIESMAKRRAELELADLEREIKKRRIETCIMTRGALKEFGVLDKETEQFLGSTLKTELLLLESPQEVQVSAPPTLWPVVNRAQHLGFRCKPGQDAKLGRVVRLGYTDFYGRDPAKKTIYHKDSARDVWAYTETECEECVDGLIRSFFRV